MPTREGIIFSKFQTAVEVIRVKSVRLEKLDRPPVVLFDWLDPLFDVGHRSAEIIYLAGDFCFGSEKGPSQRRTWVQLTEAMPDIIFAALYAFTVARSQRDVKSCIQSSGFPSLHRAYDTKVFLVDGNAYFSHPSPRLVYASKIMAQVMSRLLM
ncbi:MAG: hypothetical protein CMK30_07880 [Porticoccaceae bacterium]|nr:hypothetical protein [Porticoccaceae bacterium]